MDRISFLIDETGERLSALLNPESVSVRRRSGIRPLLDRPGTVTGHGSTDDPVLITGGGRTEIELDLVFDLDLVVGETAPNDVRSLTAAIWALSENRSRDGGPMALRMVWGKSWNVPAVVEAVSERYERFTASGAPRRSWMRLRLLRVGEPAALVGADAPDRSPPTPPATPRAPVDDVPGIRFHEVLGSGTAPSDGERLDDIAARELGSPAFWRHLAVLNDIDDPPWVRPGRILRIPPRSLLSEPAADDSGNGVVEVVERVLAAVAGRVSSTADVGAGAATGGRP